MSGDVARSAVEDSIARLSRSELQEIAGTWRNVLRLLNENRDNGDLLRLLSEIHSEWDRRRRVPRPNDLASRWKVDRERDRPLSPLSAHGYNVQFKRSLWNGERQEILRRCFEEPLMPAFVEAEMREWEEPGSITRLRKILAFLDYQIGSNFTQENKRNAVDLWRKDIDFLHALYADRFDVRWPRREVGNVQFVKE